MRKLILFGAMALALALPGATLAAHESNNKLVFAPVGSSAPDGWGSGVINYIKGISEDEPDTAWSSAFRFTGLEPGTTYTVIVRSRFVLGDVSGICTFTANAAGAGACRSEFLGLFRLGVAQLRLGGETGTPVLQATRQGAAAVVIGSITSDGGCREPDQMGSTCQAPNRN